MRAWVDVQRPGASIVWWSSIRLCGGEFIDVDELLDTGDAGWLKPQSLLQIQRTTLDELRHLLMSRREWGAALLRVASIVCIDPRNPTDFASGALHRRLGVVAAIEDSGNLLTLYPTGSDVQAIAESIDEIRDELHRNAGARSN